MDLLHIRFRLFSCCSFCTWVVSLRMSSLRPESPFPTALSPGPTSSGFQNQTFWVWSLQCRCHGLGCLRWNTKPSVLKGKFLTCKPPLLVAGCHSKVDLLARLHLCLLHPSQYGPFIFCCRGAAQLVVRSLSEGSVPCVAIDLLCP